MLILVGVFQQKIKRFKKRHLLITLSNDVVSFSVDLSPPNQPKDEDKLTPTRWRLRTATGDSGKVLGEMDACLTIGSATIQHRVLIADIEEEDVILDMDIMRAYGYELVLKNGVLRTNEEEVVLQPEEDTAIRIIVPQDTAIPECNEVLIGASLEEAVPDGRVVMVEPRNHDEEIGKGIVIAKAVIRTRKVVPVRVMNLNCYSGVLKKGTVVG